jgi:thioredoxin-like negative regulator of GroEL
MIAIRELKSVEDFHNFRDEEGDGLRICKLSAPWCGPCRTLGETIHGLDKEKLHGAVFAEINIDTDETEDVGVECRVRGVPVLIFFKNGTEVKRLTGIQSAETIYNTIEELA